MPRPERLVAVCGTGTDVGKTWAAAAVLREVARHGLSVSARKPAQSFDPPPGFGTDAQVLAGATGEQPEEVCPPGRWYPKALAPPMAAEALDRPAFTVADLLGELWWPAGCRFGLVETAGGVRSPMASDGDCADLVQALAPDITLLVADAGLGTINAVRLSRGALGPTPCLIFLNRFDGASDVHQRNLRWLVERDRLAVVTDPVVAATRLLGTV
jgi:dethiobiotin synthetase